MSASTVKLTFRCPYPSMGDDSFETRRAFGPHFREGASDFDEGNLIALASGRCDQTDTWTADATVQSVVDGSETYEYLRVVANAGSCPTCGKPGVAEKIPAAHKKATVLLS